MGQSFEITGKCALIGEKQTFGNYTVQKIGLEIQDGEYTNHAEFDVAGKQLDFMNRNKIGDMLTIKFSLSGRMKEYNGEWRIFNSMRAFYISGGTAVPSEPEQPQMAAQPMSKQAAPQMPPVMPPMPGQMPDNDDEVPF